MNEIKDIDQIVSSTRTLFDERNIDVINSLGKYIYNNVLSGNELYLINNMPNVNKISQIQLDYLIKKRFLSYYDSFLFYLKIGLDNFSINNPSKILPIINHNRYFSEVHLYLLSKIYFSIQAKYDYLDIANIVESFSNLGYLNIQNIDHNVTVETKNIYYDTGFLLLNRKNNEDDLDKYDMDSHFSSFLISFYLSKNIFLERSILLQNNNLSITLELIHPDRKVECTSII